MKRSIMKMGSATLVVSIPLKWAKRYGIKKGDNLNVEEQGNAVRISTEKTMRNDAIEIKTTNIGNIIHRVIGVLYRLGYSKIKVTYSPSNEVLIRNRKAKESTRILETFDHLTGIDITETGENYIIGNERAEIEYSEFSSTLKHLFINTLKQSDQVTSAIKKNKDIFEDVKFSERMINQNFDFCARLINLKGYEEYNKTNFIYELIKGLETISDQYYYMYADFLDNNEKTNKKISKETEDILEEVNGTLIDYFEAYYGFNKEKIEKLSMKIVTLLNKIAKIKTPDNYIILRAFTALTMIGELLEPLVAINHEKLTKDK